MVALVSRQVEQYPVVIPLRGIIAVFNETRIDGSCGCFVPTEMRGVYVESNDISRRSKFDDTPIMSWIVAS